MRIVSLLPSATEMLGILGLEDCLVGVTHGCDFPPGVERLPRVTRTVIPKGAPGAEVDRLVRERHHQGLPLYELDIALLESLAPDLLVTQGLCDVCAIAQDAVEAAACRLPGRPQVISLSPSTLSGVFQDLETLGQFTGRLDQARALVARYRDRIALVQDRVSGRGRRRVTLLEWIDPLCAAGHWTPELVDLAGGEEGHGVAGGRSRVLEWSEVLAWQPDVLVLACCGMDLAETRREARRLVELPGFGGLPCSRLGQIYLLDGVAAFSRSGPRLVDSAELLASLLHPGAVPDPGTLGWEQFDPRPEVAISSHG